MSVGKICLLVKYFINMKRKMTALRKNKATTTIREFICGMSFTFVFSLYKVVMQNKINVSNKLKIKSFELLIFVYP